MRGYFYSERGLMIHILDVSKKTETFWDIPGVTGGDAFWKPE